MKPRRAQVQAQGEARLEVSSTYSTIFEIKDDFPAEALAFDGELWRNALNLRYGVAPGTDFEVEIPLLYTTSGFLDSFIDDWHQLFFLPDGNRSDGVDDQFDMSIIKDGRKLYELEEDRLGLGDVPLIFTHQFLEEKQAGYALAWRFGVELPTGSVDRGFGNGKLDFGSGVLAEKSFGRWTATGGLDYVVVGTPTRFRALDDELSNLLDVQLGLECRWSDHLSLLGGLVWVSPVTRDLDGEEIDREILDLGLGFARDLPRDSQLSVSFHEDLVAATGPDFAVMLAWTVHL